jgi:hypothetical protein
MRSTIAVAVSAYHHIVKVSSTQFKYQTSVTVSCTISYTPYYTISDMTNNIENDVLNDIAVRYPYMI